ncbi:adenylate/guanylate cyclase domain-containing protein [Archangium violaceum]|uniref:adenylate/guanylate cyclase domain-containing protein n=1 Tax=Archangium violaceum TaxID=83451 RepID=UPI002B2B7769|nr:adenylate/guanylate cyclase domain-containing protein [Archangium gephyra]
MARRASDDSTVARFEVARANQERVLAESALRGERVVSRVRLALFVLVTFSQAVIARMADELGPKDTPRLVAVLSYLVFALCITLILHLQKKPNLGRARWMPVLTTLLDCGFFGFVAWRGASSSGDFNPQMLAASCAVVLAFSVARYSWLHVVLSTVTSSATFALVCWVMGAFSISKVSFVVGCYIALGMLIGWANTAVSSMFLGLRRRDNLSRFLPRQVVERVLQTGDGTLEPVQREVTILFSDIRDFTTLSETLPPRAVLGLLDDYFGHMGQIVMGHGGIVNKFLGDGMLACWGVPDGDAHHAVHAMQAALDMRKKLEELNAWRAQRGEPALRVGIGLHTGVVAAGMLGGAEQHEYTVIGDAVNLASRVEGLTKALGVDILVSESTWKAGQGRFRGERRSEERVKGRKEAVVVYALEGRAPPQKTEPTPGMPRTAESH